MARRKSKAVAEVPETRYRVKSLQNGNFLAGYWARSESEAIAKFHEEMAPLVIAVYADEALS